MIVRLTVHQFGESLKQVFVYLGYAIVTAPVEEPVLALLDESLGYSDRCGGRRPRSPGDPGAAPALGIQQNDLETSSVVGVLGLRA